MLLHFVISSPQINLYFTDWVSNKQSDVLLQHSCLYVAVPIDKENNPQQIISYCMSESAIQWNIQNNDFNQTFTFAELYKQQITSQQLYLWSTPIDIIEDYELFLNQLPTSMATKLFYNCTLPRFGPNCQYEFDYYKSNYFSLNEMINDYYSEHKYKPNTLTCYIHLKCNRGPAPSCLDWSEICDGKIDCLDNGIDEEYCWQLEINECEENEYLCANGQCIPFAFFRDNHLIPDCLDGSDEIVENNHTRSYCNSAQPAFQCEDVRCGTNSHMNPSYLTSSCVKERELLLLKAIFSKKAKSIPENCWTAFKCLTNMPFEDDPMCLNFSQDEQCKNIIQQTCPDILNIPDVPILFGHIYFAYTKNDSKLLNSWSNLFPYVCYNNTQCDGLFESNIFLSFNNITCIRPEDLDTARIIEKKSWIDAYLIPTYKRFWKCNSIINNASILCNRSNIYQCINSSKCISIYRLNDGIQDCYYNDDEEQLTIFNQIYTLQHFSSFFECTKTYKYDSYHPVKNGQCDYSHYDNSFYEDENLDIHYIRNHISFQTICDGFTELLPITIDGQNHTDETECEQWPCNNTYTHCDGIWHCLNGADEINCDSSPLINCPSYHHICVSFRTNKLICLPIEKANDGNIDCLGATDEPKLCRSSYDEPNLEKFYCNNNNIKSCIQYKNLCDGYRDCNYGDDEQACNITRNLTTYGNICYEQHASIRSDVEKFLCKRLNDINKQRIVYFSLDTVRNSITQTEKQDKNTILSNSSMINYERHCHRGLDLRVWFDNKNNLSRIICLCPPSYYGDKCQYQNERISLTIQFRSSSDSWQIPFLIIIFLIDNSFERIIHSSEQINYLSIKDCQIKFHNYFIYSNRPKNSSQNYSIHIDIYEKISLNYRASFLIPIPLSFLPVYRLALQLTIPHKTHDICSNDQCVHGKCLKYFNNNQTFCQCDQGWSGKYCTIPYICMCSLDSLCIGISSNNRSICVCPLNKFGSRCLLKNSICQLDGINKTCFNNGQCIPSNQYLISNERFVCICSKGFSGKRCEIIDNKIILSFNKDIILSQSIFVHFIEIRNNSFPKRSTTFKTISSYQNSILISWSHPFHIVFIQLLNKTFYFVVLQKIFNQSITISKTIQSSDRCQHINEIFNHSFIHFHLLKRIKYYHLPCQKSFSSNLSCFYDDIHICLCDHFGDQRQANCFEFDHQMKFNCLGKNTCENGAQCFQDNPTCPQTSICVCPTCFYGRRCQFSASGFSVSLDAILGYKIQPHTHLIDQPIIVQVSLAMTIIMTIVGFINSILSIITFKNKKLHEVGSGIYLLSSSIFTLLTMTMFALKFFILLGTQMDDIINRSFLNFQCISIDFFLQISLNMDHWLNACVGCERAMTSIKATKFNKRKSKKAAKYVIFILLIFIIITTIHDPLHRHLIDDDDEYGENTRIWCIVSYSPRLQIFNSTINIIHFCVPFFINIISTIIIIRSTARQRSTIEPQQTPRQHLRNQIQKHRRLLIAPTLLVIFSLPRFIISSTSGCMKSITNSWLFVTGYFVSFIPPMVTFILFILPTKTYKNELVESLKCFKRKIQLQIRHIP
jgi:hypothetical protein